MFTPLLGLTTDPLAGSVFGGIATVRSRQAVGWMIRVLRNIHREVQAGTLWPQCGQIVFCLRPSAHAVVCVHRLAAYQANVRRG